MSPAYAVSTEEILRQAQYLADSFDQTGFKWPMPKHVRRAYEDAKRSRAQFAERRAAVGQADAGHAYFISLMEKVDALLKECVEVQTLARAISLATEAESTSETVLGNTEDATPEGEDDDIFEDEFAATDSGSAPATAYGIDLPLDHLAIMRRNLNAQDFSANRKSLEDLYMPLKKCIRTLWNRVEVTGSDVKPEVAAFLTEAATVWMHNKEQELFKIREAFMEDFGEELPRMPSLAPEHQSYICSVTLNDIRESLKRTLIPYPITLARLDERYAKEMADVEDEGQAAAMIGMDQMLVHLLGQIGLETVS